MKTWQKFTLWGLGTFVLGVSAANLFFLLKDRLPSGKESLQAPKAPPPPKVASWQRYEFAQAGFSALFPAPPDMKVDSPETQGDPDEITDLAKYRMHAALEGSDYRVIARDIPKDMKIDLDSMRALVNPGRGMEMIDRKVVGDGASKAYDMTFKSVEGSYLRARAFLLNGKYFQVVVSSRQGPLDTKETEDFLGSVSLAPKAPNP